MPAPGSFAKESSQWQSSSSSGARSSSPHRPRPFLRFSPIRRRSCAGWAPRQRLEPRLDGLYQVNVRGEHLAEGRFTEVVTVHRLAYTFGWRDREDMPPGSSLIEIDLLEQNDGTLLHKTHSGLPNASSCDAHDKGWAFYLGRLAVAAGGGDPGPDRDPKAS